MGKRIKILLFSLLLPACLFPQTGGQTTYAFLETSTSPVNQALGGKPVSNPQSPDLLYFNPALLDSNLQNKASFNYRAYLAGINSGQITVTPKTNTDFNIAFGIQYINYGKFDGYDPNGNYTGQFTASDNTPYITFSLPLDTNITIGANLKTILSSYDIYKSYGFALDLGMLIKTSDLVQVAIVARNIGKQIKPYYTQAEPLPFNLSAGLTGKLRYAPLRFTITLDNLTRWNLRYQSPLNLLYLPQFADSVSTISQAGKITDEILRHSQLGTEIIMSQNLTFIIGYNYRRAQELTLPTIRTLNGLSAGFLLKTKKLDFAYSFAKYGMFTTHSFGITLKY